MSGDVNGNSSNKRDRLQDTNIRLTPALDTCTQVLHVKWSRPMLNGNERQRRLTALGCCRNVAPSVSFQCDIGGLNCRGLSWTAVPSAVGQTALLCWVDLLALRCEWDDSLVLRCEWACAVEKTVFYLPTTRPDNNTPLSDLLLAPLKPLCPAELRRWIRNDAAHSEPRATPCWRMSFYNFV